MILEPGLGAPSWGAAEPRRQSPRRWPQGGLVAGHGNSPTQRRRRGAVVAVVAAAARGGGEGWRHRQSWRRCGRGDTPTRVRVSHSRRRRARPPATHKGLSSGTNRPSAHLPTVAAAHAGHAAQPFPGDAGLVPSPSFGSALVGGVTAGVNASPSPGSTRWPFPPPSWMTSPRRTTRPITTTPPTTSPCCTAPCSGPRC